MQLDSDLIQFPPDNFRKRKKNKKKTCRVPDCCCAVWNVFDLTQRNTVLLDGTGTEGKLCVPCDRKDVSGALTLAGTLAALGLLSGTL